MPSGSDTNFTFQNPTIPSSEPSSFATRTNETGLNSASPCHDCGWIAPALGPSEDPHPADALETRTIPSKTITRVAVTAVLNIVLLPLSISWPPQLVDMETMCALTRSRPSAPGPSIDPDGIRRVGMLGVLPDTRTVAKPPFSTASSGAVGTVGGLSKEKRPFRMTSPP